MAFVVNLTHGINDFTKRVHIKDLFEQFGEISACWLPPVGHRHTEYGYIKFKRQAAADESVKACARGQVDLWGRLIGVEHRLGPTTNHDDRDFEASGSNLISSRELFKAAMQKELADKKKGKSSRKQQRSSSSSDSRSKQKGRSGGNGRGRRPAALCDYEDRDRRDGRDVRDYPERGRREAPDLRERLHPLGHPQEKGARRQPSDRDDGGYAGRSPSHEDERRHRRRREGGDDGEERGRGGKRLLELEWDEEGDQGMRRGGNGRGDIAPLPREDAPPLPRDSGRRSPQPDSDRRSPLPDAGTREPKGFFKAPDFGGPKDFAPPARRDDDNEERPRRPGGRDDDNEERPRRRRRRGEGGSERDADRELQRLLAEQKRGGGKDALVLA